MTAILQRRQATSLWASFCDWITSTNNRLYVGWFGVIMIRATRLSNNNIEWFRFGNRQEQ